MTFRKTRVFTRERVRIFSSFAVLVAGIIGNNGSRRT